jgi:antitoxin component YwqK of YwqJK toxin-antitoxin module
LDAASAYHSSIPANAEERVVGYDDAGSKEQAEYYLAGELVGRRYFHSSGEPSFEMAFRAGRLHGVQYRWDIPGQLLSAEPYVDGLPHGTAYQWDATGRLIGSYKLTFRIRRRCGKLVGRPPGW